MKNNKKKIIFVTFFVLVFFAIALFIGFQKKENHHTFRNLDCMTYTCESAMLIPQGIEIMLYHAETEAQKTLGLSGTGSLLPNTGMLFSFDTSNFWGIWMKDMHYPIDILWLDSTLRIIHIERTVYPDTYPHVFIPMQPAQFVIELPAGFSDIYTIEIGNYFQIKK